MATDKGYAAKVINPRATQTDVDAADVDAADVDAADVDAADLHAAAGAREATIEERFGHAVLRLRLYWGWSQRELQRRSGVHRSQISRLESGRQRGLSTRRLFAILRALRVGEIA